MSVPRWELLRALGAVADSPAGAVTACRALGLAAPGSAEHTDVFVLNCPPYAAVCLGAEGGLGGEAADRAAGFWRALGLSPPSEPDHLTALFTLYANLGEAAGDAGRPSTRGGLDRARRALLNEHLWPWLPSYLDAVTDLATPALPGWAALVMRALQAEHTSMAGAGEAADARLRLPLALRTAAAPLTASGELGDLLDVLTAPIRSGMILTRRRLAAAAAGAGAGHRIGERRFTLRALLEQAPQETLSWLGDEAQRWQERHISRGRGDPVHAWWAQRAGHTSELLSREAQAA